jgi:hypothetical protein
MFCNGHCSSFFCFSITELCHTLLYYKYYFEHGVQRQTAYSWSPDWLICFVLFLLFRPPFLFVPGTSSWRRLFLLFYSGVPRSAAVKDTFGVVKFEENTLPVVIFCFPWDFFRISSFAWLQPRKLAGCAVSPICPDVAKLLAAVAFRKGSLWFIQLCLDGNVSDVKKFENVSGFCRPRQGY